ncbi:hypothetical protein ACHHYP_14158 [Achlya hypogyna]|uniref:B box-type domain-containing protein n=1 Tax=Achlya hypogyna TaxID=1202772 RepID=A0A1V9YDQ8_ACHHY|nr:hypothetical protein ACHHYP_14158 [Achlya hypogyna]
MAGADDPPPDRASSPDTAPSLLICEECAKRPAAYHCDDCALTLCINCSEAIHLIPSLSAHVVRGVRIGDIGYMVIPRTDIARIARRPPPPAIAKLELHGFRYGQPVAFRDGDLGRGLLFGLALSRPDDQPRMGPCNGQFVRVLWLRGVLPLPNQCFLAVLTLPAHWPVRLEAYVSVYHAYRMTVLAEKTARKLWRREKYAGRLRRLRDQKAFPTDAIVDEVLRAVEHDGVGVTAAHMETERFLSAVVAGTLDGDEAEPESDAPYPPATRARLVLLPAAALSRPQDVAATCLARVVRHMVGLYIGYAWSAWRRWVAAGQARDHAAFLSAQATVLQRWIRRRWQGWQEAQLRAARSSGLSALEALRRYQDRQVSVQRIHEIWAKTLRRLQQRGVAVWKQAADALKATDVARPPDAPWHPALGIRLLKLPKAYAFMKSDGSLGVEDIAKYKQFRINHAGPTAVSYWIVRERILMGKYPQGPAFPEKKRKADQGHVASRADSLTCILLEQVGTFVCLMPRDELCAYEATLEAAAPQAAFTFEAQLAERHAKLTAELEKAVTAAQKYVVSATKSWQQQAERDANTEEFVRDLMLKKKSAAEANLRTALENQRRLQPVRVMHCPLPKAEAPPEETLLELLPALEDRLRAGENMYVFSRQGRGRAAMVAALLLGRLYGLSAQQALERTQRCHDAQKALANLPSTRLVSAPESLDQIRAVHQQLASTATIYEPVATSDGDDYLVLRRQRRGLAVQTFAATKGFMVDEFPSVTQQTADRAALAAANRTALKEKRALQLRVRRAMEGVERGIMLGEETWSRFELPIWTELLHMRASEVDGRRRWREIEEAAERARMTGEDLCIFWPEDAVAVIDEPPATEPLPVPTIAADLAAA